MNNRLSLEEIRLCNEKFPLFCINVDDPEVPLIQFNDIHIAHCLTFEYFMGDVIRIKDFTGQFAMLLNDNLEKSYRGKFFCDQSSIPDTFYFSLLDMNIKIFNDNHVDIKSLIRRWKIHNIIK